MLSQMNELPVSLVFFSTIGIINNYLTATAFDVSYLLISNNGLSSNDLNSIDRDALARTVSDENRFEQSLNIVSI